MSESVSGASSAPKPTPAQSSVLGRIETIVRAAEQDIVHDEQALVAWVKAELAKL
jgi:hypothetical protein